MRGIKNLFLILSIIACFGVSSCDLGGGYSYYDASPGLFSGISSVRVFYPNDSSSHNAVTLSGGFINSKENMYWLAEHLAKNGIIVFALSASNNLSVSGYESAHNGCITLINSENARFLSPIYGKVKKIGLIGYSMGGGAAANVGNSVGSSVATVIGLAPFGSSWFLYNMSAATMFIGGSADIIASPALFAQPSYNSLPLLIKKACVIISGIEHLIWIIDVEAGKTLVTNWIKYTMDGDLLSYAVLKTFSYYGSSF